MSPYRALDAPRMGTEPRYAYPTRYQWAPVFCRRGKRDAERRSELALFVELRSIPGPRPNFHPDYGQVYRFIPFPLLLSICVSFSIFLFSLSRIIVDIYQSN